MNKIKVKQFIGVTGKPVSNQYLIYIKDDIYFQSYDKIISVKINGKIYLDENYWNYSRTTSRYRNIFLNENLSDIKKKIKTGEYILTNLNGD